MACGFQLLIQSCSLTTLNGVEIKAYDLLTMEENHNTRIIFTKN